MTLPLTFLDAKELEAIIEAAVQKAVILAVSWRAVPPPPPFTNEELAARTPPGERTWHRAPSNDPRLEKAGTFPEVPPPRYASEAIALEMSFILYRVACRLGLHKTGTEAILLAALSRVEREVAAEQGLDAPARALSEIDDLIKALDSMPRAEAMEIK